MAFSAGDVSRGGEAVSDRSAGRSAAPISSGNPVFSPNPALTNNGQVDSGGVILKMDPSLPQAIPAV